MPYEKVKVLRQVAGKDFEELDVAPPGGASRAAVAERGGYRWRRQAGAAADRRRISCARSCCSADAAAAELDQHGRLDLQREGTDQRRGQQLPPGRRRRRAQRHQRRPLALPARCRTQGADAVRARRAGVWQVVRNLPLPVSDFTSLQPVALGAGKTEHRRASSA